MAVLKRFNGSVWDAVVGGSGIIKQTTAPVAPNVDDLWLDTDAIASQQTTGLVAEQVVTGSPVTSITFSGLDINTYDEYIVSLDMMNATGSDADMFAYVNSDTSSNNTDYYAMLFYTVYSAADNSVSYTKANSPKWVAGNLPASVSCRTIMTIRRNYQGNIFMYSQFHGGTGTATTIYNASCRKNTTVTNLTSLTITSSVASSIAIGSTIRIYRRK